MIIDHLVFTSPREFTSIYVGISPPLKYMVNTKIIATLFLAVNSFLDNG